MTIFLVICSILTLMVIGTVLIPLLRDKPRAGGDRVALNVDIAREHLRELDAELAAGRITDSNYAKARQEIEYTLAEDVSTATVHSVDRKGRPVATAVLVSLALPAAAATLYLQLGTPAALNAPNAATIQDPQTQPDVHAATMVASLAARLRETPDDAQGWDTLAKSYMVLGRYNEAADAMRQVRRLTGDTPEVLLRLADALAMSARRRMRGAPESLIQQALAIAPDHPQGLWMAGMSAQQRGENEAALGYWRRLEPKLAADPRQATNLASLRQLMSKADADRSLAITRTASASVASSAQALKRVSLAVTVDVADELRRHIHSDDAVFVFARAASGPPMPLAVLRRTASELPLTVTLDDSLAVTSNMKLSDFTNVTVGARISKSGTAAAGPGDLEGFTTGVMITERSEARVVIDRKRN